MSEAVLEHPMAGDAGEGIDGGSIEQLALGRGVLPVEGQCDREQCRGSHQQDRLPDGIGAHFDARLKDQGHGEAGEEGMEREGRARGE
jgi:hypothetical protein